MKIVNLIENTPGVAGCAYEHGLSFYIETEKHKILVDTGASDKFLENARILGIDLKQVDSVFLSHGHYDHSGGLLAFAQINPQAKIYMQRTATGAYYHAYDTGDKYIGIDSQIAVLPQVIYIEENQKLDEELVIFSNVTGRLVWPKGNRELVEKTAQGNVQDSFRHEQYLVISQGGKKYLLSGCAHNGVLNILEKYQELYQEEPDVMISGFHMMKKSGYDEQDIAMMKETAKRLLVTKTKFYTGHCTGEHPFAVMKEILGEKLQYCHSGDEIFT